MQALFRPTQWRSVYKRFPQQFWLVVLAGFIDRIGGTMLYPFFAIYIADRYDVGLTEIAYVMLVTGMVGFVASFIGGNLTDRYGRKGLIVTGLLASAMGSLGIGVSPTLIFVLLFAVVAGFFNEIGGPAHQAMIADMIPEEQRSEAFAILRIAINIAFVAGPIAGGLIATQSFLALFIIDAITSSITAFVVLRFIKETYQPQHEAEDRPAGGVRGTLKSYVPVLADRSFMMFVTLAVAAGFVYQQMYVALPYYMYEIDGMPASHYSFVLSLNALLVVVVQLPVMAYFKKWSPLVALAAACLFYAVGFSMYGIFAGLLLYMVAMIFITVGEMIFFPVAQAFATQLAPESARGRYMAIFGFGFAIPGMFSTLPAGFIMDNADPALLWYACGVLASFAALSYWLMRQLGHVSVSIEDSPSPLAPAVEGAAGAD